MVTGFSECIDSFFAFGLFETARRSGFFPAELVETFEPVVHEEGRHIVVFANWVEWRRKQLNIFQRIAFEMKVWAVWVFLAYERMGIANGMDDEDRQAEGQGGREGESRRQLHRHRRQPGRRRPRRGRADAALPGGGRPAPGPIRPAPQAPRLRAQPRATGAGDLPEDACGEGGEEVWPLSPGCEPSARLITARLRLQEGADGRVFGPAPEPSPEPVRPPRARPDGRADARAAPSTSDGCGSFP